LEHHLPTQIEEAQTRFGRVGLLPLLSKRDLAQIMEGICLGRPSFCVDRPVDSRG